MSSKQNKVGVIGSGQMGFGIAQVFASHNNIVYVQDQSIEIVITKKKQLISRLENKEKKDASANLANTINKIREYIIPSQNFANFASCDLIIEAVIEDFKIKRDLLQQIDKVANKTAIIGSNTSSISITKLQSVIKNPGNFIGIHFMNPANIMKLVEIIPGLLTSNSTIEQAKDKMLSVGKEVVISKDYSAFIVNRILIPMINEAIFVLYENTASISDIDKAMQFGANHKLGPLQLADMIGLDICLAVMDNLYSENKDSKYRACPLLKKMVEAGKLGKKSSEGFYKY